MEIFGEDLKSRMSKATNMNLGCLYHIENESRHRIGDGNVSISPKSLNALCLEVKAARDAAKEILLRAPQLRELPEVKKILVLQERTDTQLNLDRVHL